MFSVSKHLSSNIRRTFGKLHCKQCSTKQTKIHQLQTDNSSSIKRMELYGQPTPETHPHIMKPGELSPGITPSEFDDRRNRLMEKILTNPKNQYHLAVIPSAPKVYMTEKIPYVFRQNSDFFYLTGCLEPDSVLVMCGNTPENYSSTLFIRKRDAHSELWDGPRTGAERAAGFFGVNQSLPLSELRPFLTSYLKLYPSAVLWYDYFSNIHNAVHNTMNVILEESKGKQSWESPRDYIHKLRLIKSPAEQRLIQESCNIASAAIAKAMSVSKPGVTEHQLFATVDYECRMNGAEILAYPPVVAAGNNATIIHYINNTQQTQSGDMVLMDAGCEYHGYISDITRTWPVNGKFTDPQRVLYEVILALQLELIQLCHNLPTLDGLFQSMCQLLGSKLKEAGVFSSNIPDDKLAKIAYEFCPHHVSHYLGMDVHDTALITRNIRMQPGMVLTVEPGIYVSHNNDLARPEFKGLGIRIEDDILITESGPHVLSAKCPKEVREVEKIVTSVTWL